MISRPIRQLLEKIRQVSEGELEAVVKLPQQDELGEIGRALNRMSDGIAASQRRIEAESQARVAAVEQLRHAERLMTVGKLASGLAHELGTPLNVVFGRAELTMLDERASADARDNARIIRDQTQRMIVIIRQLLDFARKKPPHKRRADVAAIARQAVDLLQPIAQKRGVRLDVEAGGEPAAIAIDEGQIMQVTTNLLQNAIQATADGGHVAVRVGWVDARPPADADGARAGRHVALTVEDDGCGMAPDTLARIFEPFFTTKEVGQGTGLGLSVAYGIVREHGGWIAVESAAGKGSTFRVHLPGVAVAATEPNDAGVAAQEGRA
jgi:signal transduction histidine kinase